MNKVRQAVRVLMAPRKLIPPSEWVPKHCILRDNITESPGPVHIFPYAVEPVNSMVDPYVSKITLCWASQTSKTTSMYSSVAYLLSEFPKDTIWVMPSAENARQFSKGRWLPFVEDCIPLRAQCPISATTGRIDSDKITNMRQEFIPCTLTFTGAGSENNVKSAPVAYLILDEIDEIDRDIRLAALERVKGRREHKIIQTSTPKEESAGVWEEYTYGDQRVYFMPCPHCGELIDFRWRQEDGEGRMRYSISFDPEAKQEDGSYDFERVVQTSRYICPECGKEIHDGHKHDMLRSGQWIPKNKNAPPGHRSYHLNSMYSPIVTFGGMMVEWLQASQSMHGLKKFVQGWLAEPWREEWVNQEQSDSKVLEGDYQRGEIKGEYRYIAADTQTDHFRYIVRGFDRDGENYLIDYGSVASFAELDTKLDQYQCSRGIIDSAGDRTQEIYEEVYRRRGKWFASRGWDKMAEPYRIQKKDPFTGDNKGRSGKAKILYLHVNKEVWEGEIAQLRTRQVGGFWTFEDTPKDYYDQLFAVYWARETQRNGSIKLVRKVRKTKGDHYFDCECLARAISKFFGIARPDTDAAHEAAKAAPVKNRSSRSRSATSFWD